MDQDGMWVDHALKELPSVPVPAGLEARILGDFDRMAARRGGFFARLRETVWPDAPLWRPAGALAAALVIGIAVGDAVPLEDEGDQATVVALDQPPSFELGESS